MVVMVGDLRKSAAELLREQGVSFRRIGERFGVRHQTVERWIYGSRGKCPCGEPLRRGSGATVCGFCVEEAIANLSGPRRQRLDAVESLRAAGLSARAVILVRRARLKGASVAQVSVLVLGAVR